MLTVNTPYGDQETFLADEIIELSKQFEVVLIPKLFKGKIFNSKAAEILQATDTVARPLFSLEIALAALVTALRHPVTLAAVLLMLGRTHPVNLLKNLAVLPKALWISRLVRKRGCTHIYAHWASTTATMALVAHRFSGVPWSFTAHRGDITLNNLLQVKIAGASFVRIISASARELFAKRVANPDWLKFHLIRMGVILPQRVADAARAPRVILCPANLFDVKGHRYLLEAMALVLPRLEVKLLIAGDGPLLGALKSSVQELGIAQAVDFLGRVPNEVVLRYYQNEEIGAVVLPSIDLGCGNHEGIPVALIEAMSCGIPVISTRTGGIPELLGGDCGLMVPDKDAAALAEAIHAVLTDRELRVKLTGHALARVAGEYCLQHTIGQLCALINASCPSPSPTSESSR
jgi:glycosyltransferase involved in cell wall biosynthesis